MKSCIHSIVRNATKSDKPKNIVVLPYDGIFEYHLCKYTQHNYYIVPNLQRLSQPTTSHPHMIGVDGDIAKWPLDIDMDMLICNDIIAQAGPAKQIATILHIPIIVVHHTPAQGFVKKEDIFILKDGYRTSTRIVIDPIINNSWYDNFPVIQYCTEQFKEKPSLNRVLVVGNFDPQSIEFIRALQQQSKLSFTILGNNVGLSEATTYEKVVAAIKTHRIFLNLYNDSDLNPFMLMALASGCTVLSSPSIMTNTIINNGMNGYICTSAGEFIRYINGNILPTISIRAKQTAARFTTEQFGKKWNDVIEQVAVKPYRI